MMPFMVFASLVSCIFICSDSFEGPKGFYKGLKPSLVRVVPATMITMVTYEHVSHFLLTKKKAREEAG